VIICGFIIVFSWRAWRFNYWPSFVSFVSFLVQLLILSAFI